MKSVAMGGIVALTIAVGTGRSNSGSLEDGTRRDASIVMQRVERDAPLPVEMQGRWIDVDEPKSELVVSGGRITYRGRPVAYDYKEVSQKDGAISVSLRINDPTQEDTFQRANITELVITPEGEFHAYNVKFAIQLVRRPAR